MYRENQLKNCIILAKSPLLKIESSMSLFTVEMLTCKDQFPYYYLVLHLEFL